MSKSEAKYRMTRRQVADRIGKSVYKVRSMEGKELHPRVRDGVNYFDPEEVERVAAAMGASAKHSLTGGQLAAKMFEMFAEGWQLPDIVCALEVEPKRVRELYSEWCRGDLHVAEVERLNAIREAKRKKEEAEQERVFKEWEKELRRPHEEMLKRERAEKAARSHADLNARMKAFEKSQAHLQEVLERILRGSGGA